MTTNENIMRIITPSISPDDMIVIFSKRITSIPKYLNIVLGV